MNTELNFPRRLLAGLTALALLLMLALPVWAEGEETEKLPVSINSVEDLLQLVTDCRLDSWSCLLYTSPSPRDRQKSRMPSSA